MTNNCTGLLGPTCEAVRRVVAMGDPRPLPQPADPPASEDAWVHPRAEEHREIGGWKGPDGCGVECACGVSFGGFAALAEAGELLAGHIRDATNSPQSARLTALERFAETVESALTTPGLSLDARLAHIHTAHARLTWSRP